MADRIISVVESNGVTELGCFTAEQRLTARDIIETVADSRSFLKDTNGLVLTAPTVVVAGKCTLHLKKICSGILAKDLVKFVCFWLRKIPAWLLMLC